MSRILTICQQVNVIPVLVVNDVARAVPLAEALLSGGLSVLEVTLRTAAALEVIREMSTVEGSIVGAGTVLNARDIAAVRAAGADFAVSPGCTPELINAAADHELPLLPGAATASEVMALMDQGFEMLKFFPAEAAGGISMLKSLAGPLPAMKFCPTGGINASNLQDYLALPNVVCVGGSWLTPASLVDNHDWQQVTALAKQCSTPAEG
ncbi:MAG: keto-deoxy-phosphogluconate aldolase [Rhodobacterales bacterium]|nr:MAG: keto-deoxy-phosphogluconate aldolase [Rhodobacterales bacterium]